MLNLLEDINNYEQVAVTDRILDYTDYTKNAYYEMHYEFGFRNITGTQEGLCSHKTSF